MRLIRPKANETLWLMQALGEQLQRDQFASKMAATKFLIGEQMASSDAEVLVMIPSRSRPESLLEACESVLATSNAAVIAFIDMDQHDLYTSFFQKNAPGHIASFEHRPGTNTYDVVKQDQETHFSRITIHTGTRNGPVSACNTLCHAARPGGGLRQLFENVHIFTYMTDDSTMVTPGWDKWLIEVVKGFKNEIGIVSASSGGADYVNFISVSTNMVEAMGWFATPTVSAWLWDTAAELIGDATAIRYATPEEFNIVHKQQVTLDSLGSPDVDFRAFGFWCISERKRTIKSVRARMNAEPA